MSYTFNAYGPSLSSLPCFSSWPFAFSVVRTIVVPVYARVNALCLPPLLFQLSCTFTHANTSRAHLILLVRKSVIIHLADLRPCSGYSRPLSSLPLSCFRNLIGYEPKRDRR